MDESEIEFSEIVDFVENSDSFVSDSVMPLGMAQSNLVERLYKKVGKYLAHPDMQMVMDDLRTELYAGISAPPLNELHSVSLNCIRCKEVIEPNSQTLPKWNVTDPDLLLIAETPSFGDDASTLLVEALKESGFSSTRVGLTYINRCRLRSGMKFSAEHMRNCSTYLFPEIQILQPKVIMTLGLIPFSTFFGSAKLASVRGNSIWLGPWHFLPTYSPGFAASRNRAGDFKADIARAYGICYG